MSRRLDKLLVDRGLARSRGHADELIKAAQVLVDGTVADRPSRPVGPDAEVRLAGAGPTYVSRAAYKLLGALDDLELTPYGRALDAGASTGGFTQVLLERGCDQVIAVDVGHDQLAQALRADPRVTVLEGLHLRDLTPDLVGPPVDWVTADVSFVSLTKIIEPVLAVVDPAGTLLLMVKPQFEVGRERLGKGGVVRDPALWSESVRGVLDAAHGHGWQLHGAARSRLPGPAGNEEFFVLLRRGVPTGVRDLSGLALG